MKQTSRIVAGVTLLKVEGCNPDSWYAHAGPDLVLIEFRPSLGWRSKKPFAWTAYSRVQGYSDIVARGGTLTRCVEQVRDKFWGTPEFHDETLPEELV